ncbi:bifunctional [glutamine synthetase] adenylyltransferase/[glutamine synthetase]-adenylyl-L-tyrosine phosphorylase [Microterricola viridarii]|uniref:Glutamine-synthetase adenylyltransferase n=1 Tax=Microterricola viridarii TaxID=412690 RepID=A0A120I0Z6_9MICO|nr:bifunctional [glutamine synthetase] adenylyltransferase/[glutamine synthetase]-adenylyl-L-tyrosine phosphorylase [Microterricola viridarii]AMB58564.1 glutamine-synthetase adenylyltransferase [Microterricola viridarii]
MAAERFSLTELARAGFLELGAAATGLAEFAELSGADPRGFLADLGRAADPDGALRNLIALLRQAPDEAGALLAEPETSARLIRVLGASEGLAEFFLRQPAALSALAEPLQEPPGAAELGADMLDAVAGSALGSAGGDEAAWQRMRVRYRWWLTRLAAFDLEQDDPVAGVDAVAGALADLAGATLDASLAVARRAVTSDGSPAFGLFDATQVEATRFSIMGMGKAGAHELNYVSDVDVIFIADAVDGVEGPRAVEIATRLAMLTMRGIAEPLIEPALWEVDANLRPEGKDGALVRTLESHLAYYERWAKNWEFQALLKARPLAGDLELGERYVSALAPAVWNSSDREGFVESVQRMRERVTAHIPDDEVDVQLKLGPGGLRDIEFTVQLLQLVHGQADESVRAGGTLPALVALAEAGYIGRAEAAEFARDYRMLRLLEHRLQLQRLRRTHLMPRDEDALRVLARASGLASSANELSALRAAAKHRVRGLHERLFYRPLLSAVAALPVEGLNLTSAQAEARLAAIGFVDPRGALAHIAALTAGVSRRATIQRHLLPVMLQWFADGADPDYGLLAFRRLSDGLGGTHWFLRMLRDSSGAAERLTRVLSGSRFIGELLELTPESVAWLETEEELRPRSRASLAEETRAVLARHESPDAAAAVLRGIRRREVLRLAFSATLDLCSVEELGQGLSDVTENLIDGLVRAIRGPLTATESGAVHDGIEFAVIAMGRFGGQELGFGSDADVMYVYRAAGLEPEQAQKRAQFIVAGLNRLSEDSRLPLDLDIGLRPEGKNGAATRSLDSYKAYYARWSLTWEAQALLRARGSAGDEALLADFMAAADTVRYPAEVPESAVREVKRIKARVESERLPQGADPLRHLKLGRGSLSDVEWFVQLLQLQHGASTATLRTPSTLSALHAATDAGLVSPADAEMLRAAWLLASRARSAMTLWTNRTSDMLPRDRIQLEGVARLLNYPPGAANQLDEDYLAVTRRARAVFEREFYGVPERGTPSTG